MLAVQRVNKEIVELSTHTGTHCDADDPGKAAPPHTALLGNGKSIVEELYFPGEMMERRVGRLDQIAGITPVELVDWPQRGVRASEVATGSGFAFTAIADRALDEACAMYQGIALWWRSRNGIVSPAYYEPQGDEFLRSFFGGLFTTCELTNFGPPGSDRRVACAPPSAGTISKSATSLRTRAESVCRT